MGEQLKKNSLIDILVGFCLQFSELLFLEHISINEYRNRPICLEFNMIYQYILTHKSNLYEVF